MASHEHPLSYASYLSCKKPVDDRALNRHVLGVLRDELARQSAPLKVLEIGAGLGTMIARLADWNILSHAEYTLLDVDSQTLEQAPLWLADWAAATGRRLERESGSMRIVAGDPATDIVVRTVCSDVHDFLDRERSHGDMDLLIANAFLDLVDVPRVLPQLLQAIGTKGRYWFSLNFDGETIFEPEHPLDALLMPLYHRSMDERISQGRRAGDSRTGRHLFRHLRAAGATILAAGSSDWVVHAVDGRYADRDADFLEHILHTIEVELGSSSQVDPRSLQAWSSARRSELQRGDLVYVAHQIDFVGRVRPEAG